jgi:hypothetical protein
LTHTHTLTPHYAYLFTTEFNNGLVEIFPVLNGIVIYLADHIAGFGTDTPG